MVSPKSSRSQKAYWNKNGSITVVEVMEDQLQQDLPPYIPETLQIQQEKVNDSVQRNSREKFSIMPEGRKVLMREKKISFDASADFPYYSREKRNDNFQDDRCKSYSNGQDNTEEKFVTVRNFCLKGRKIINLGDSHLNFEDSILPDFQWFVRHKLNVFHEMIFQYFSFRVLMLGGPKVGKSTISTRFSSSAHSRNLQGK